MLAAINNISISRKVTYAFVLIAILVGALGYTSMTNLKTLSGIASAHVDRGISGTEALGRLTNHLREHRIIIWTETNAETPQEMAALKERFVENRAGLREAIDDYAQVAEELTPQLESLEGRIEELEAVNGQIFAVMEESGPRVALPLVRNEGKAASEAAIREANALINLTRERAERNDTAGDAAAESAIGFATIFGAVSLIVLAGLWLLITRTVSTPLAAVAATTKRLAEGAQAEVPHRGRGDEIGEVAGAVEMFRMAAIERAEQDARSAREQKTVTEALGVGLEALKRGDLTSEVVEPFPISYETLRTNFNEAVHALRDLIGSVTESAAAIRSGSGEIMSASEDLARRTEANAASLEETSASLTEVDGRVKATAKAAEQTVERADQAISTVADGRAVAESAVQAMGRVSENAQDIDAVIEGLDKIAFQTRVLAMNAAVEAGRAGEAGRGFAVVADLVSALAMRAEEESKNAREQLTVTQTGIQSAVDAVTKVDGALAEISTGVGEVHQLLGSMAQDNQAQASALTQVTAAIGDMDKATQQNAAMVEETSAAARSLSSEVNTLAQQAGRFTVSKSSTVRAPVNKVHELVDLAQKSVANPPATKKVANGASVSADADWNEF